MIHRIEHALVMDTDDIPGRGGYAVVGMSPGLYQAERVFVAENFGISDYLHDPQNDRAFYSFCRVPGGRFAFVRRFAKGLRRSGSQSRVFVHTLFLEDAAFDALHGLPWLLIESKFRRGSNDAWQPLALDYGPLIDSATFAALEWQPEPELVDDPARRLQARLALLGRRLAAVDPIDAAGSVLAALQNGRRSVLPQGSVYELLTILAWSMLPIGDRATLAWTQHDSANVAVDYAIANAPNAEFVVAPNEVTRRIVEMNTSGEESWREFQTRAARYPLSIRGDAIEAWLRWREALSRVVARADEEDTAVVAKLEKVARTARPNRNDPWIDGAEVLQLLWSNISSAIDAKRDAAAVAMQWASRFQRSGLGEVIFREPPSDSWLDRVARELGGADLVVRFYIFGTDDDVKGAPTRAAVASWVIAQRDRTAIGTDLLARLAVRLASDRSPLLAQILECVLDDPQGLTMLAGATPLKPATGDMVLLATILAVQRSHAQAALYVRTTLLLHLERSEETRRKVNENVAFAVAAIVRGDAETFVRFVMLLDAELQQRLTAQVVEWLRSDSDTTMPLAREILAKTNPLWRETGALAFAAAAAGETADSWSRVVLHIAADIDVRSRKEAQWFAEEVDQLDREQDVDLLGLLESLSAHLQRAAVQRQRAGASLRALVELTRAAWSDASALILHAVRDVLETGSAREWDTIAAALARVPGAARADVDRMLLSFWTHVEPGDIPNLSDDVLSVTRRIDGEPRIKLVEHWTPRLRQLPANARAERFIALVQDLEKGRLLKVRIELGMRAIDQGSATRETLNALDEDLWDHDSDAYSDEIAEAIGSFAAMKVHGVRPSPLERVRRLLDLVSDPHVEPAVKLAIEERMPLELSSLTRSEWNQVVRTPAGKLLRSGSVLMSVARHAGGADADAADELESLSRELEWRDALDGIAAGRVDTEGTFRRIWKRGKRLVKHGLV